MNPPFGVAPGAGGRALSGRPRAGRRLDQGGLNDETRHPRRTRRREPGMTVPDETIFNLQILAINSTVSSSAAVSSALSAPAGARWLV